MEDGQREGGAEEVGVPQVESPCLPLPFALIRQLHNHLQPPSLWRPLISFLLL